MKGAPGLSRPCSTALRRRDFLTAAGAAVAVRAPGTRPGSNITGVSVDTGVEIAGKRLQILKEAVPSATNAAYLDVGLAPKGAVTGYLADASQRLGISLRVMPVKEATRAEYERVFEE